MEKQQNFFGNLFNKKPSYEFTTIPQAQRDLYKLNIEDPMYNEIYSILKDKDPIGVFMERTRKWNSRYGCNVYKFMERLDLAIPGHLYTIDRINQILDYKREHDYPHKITEDGKLSFAQLKTLVYYIKGKEQLWDDDSLREMKEYKENKTQTEVERLKAELEAEKQKAAEAIAKFDEANAYNEARRLQDIEEGTQWLIDHGVPADRLQELRDDEKLIYANIEEAKRVYPRLIHELSSEIIVGEDVDLDVVMDAVMESIKQKLTDDDQLNNKMLREEIKRLGKQFDEEYVKGRIEQEFGKAFKFSWTSAHYKRPNGCEDCEKTVFIQAYPRILFNK